MKGPNDCLNYLATEKKVNDGPKTKIETYETTTFLRSVLLSARLNLIYISVWKSKISLYRLFQCKTLGVFLKLIFHLEHDSFFVS